MPKNFKHPGCQAASRQIHIAYEQMQAMNQQMKEFYWQIHAANYCNNLKLPANQQTQATDQQAQATN